MSYLFCVVLSGVVETCIPVGAGYGFRFCADDAKGPAGGLLTDSDRPGRFVVYDADESCGSMGCQVLSGRYDRKEVARDLGGVAFATAVVHDGEQFADGMEPLDLHAESSCTSSRIIR